MTIEDVGSATARYEAWLAGTTAVDTGELQHKHHVMTESAFVFLRATFYRWSQVFPHRCDVADAPRVLGVGDVHIENFGLWRDAEGRLVWGVNDFDEATDLPYTNDLVRLVTSARLALTDLDVDRIAGEVLAGYRETLERGGRSLVLGERNASLWHLASSQDAAPSRFWRKLLALGERAEVPTTTRELLESAMPDGTEDISVRDRVAGLGSLGRPRATALARWHGALVAREVKQLSPSGWVWAHGGDPRIRYADVLTHARRSPDPFLAVHDTAVVRRLAPDSRRVDLDEVRSAPRRLRLLRFMGAELANVHLGDPGIGAVTAHAAGLSAHDLEHASSVMAAAIQRDLDATRRARRTRSST